ncbi:MAG: amidohydrolase family protein [Bryobacteraceae bacterium]
MTRLICIAALCGAAFAQSPSPIALRDARVVTVSGPVIERGAVVLRNGLIEAVGETVAIPPDAWVMDAKGLTVYPGLIDALMPAEAPEPAAAAVPTSRSSMISRTPSTPSTPGQPAAPPPARGPEDRPATTSWVRAADLFSATDRRIEEARNAGFTSAAVFPTNGIFAGQGAVVNLAGEKRRMIVASPVGQYVGAASRSFMSYPGSLMGVIAYIRQVYLDAAHYQVQKQAYERKVSSVERPDYDRALEGVLESPRALLPARTAVEMDRMARFAAELKVKAVLYGGEAGYRAAPALAQANLPVLVSLKWPERSRDADPEEVESMRTLEHRERAPGSPAALAKAGVLFAFYTDGTAARDLARAVRRAADAGLRPADLVRAFTLSPAEIYGVADRLGSVERGKIANLLVTEGDLFGEKTKIRYVFIDGVKFEPPPPEAVPAPSTGGAQ